MTRERILELAEECFKTSGHVEWNEIESFYRLAHQDGQRAMREFVEEVRRTGNTRLASMAIGVLSQCNTNA